MKRSQPSFALSFIPVLLSLTFVTLSAGAQTGLPGQAPKITTSINAVNLNPQAESPAEERGIELRAGTSGVRSVYSAKYRGTDGRELSTIIPEEAYQQMNREMTSWFKMIEMSSSPRRMISCRDKIAMVQDSKSFPLCLDGLDEKQRPLFQNWYADVRNQIRANEW